MIAMTDKLGDVTISFGPWAQRFMSALLGLIFYVWFPVLLLAVYNSWPLFWLSLIACAVAWVYVWEYKKTHR